MEHVNYVHLSSLIVYLVQRLHTSAHHVKVDILSILGPVVYAHLDFQQDAQCVFR